MKRDTQGPQASNDAFQLGEWLVEPSLNRLSCGYSTVQLELKLMDLLLFLVAQKGEVAGKVEIIDAVWQTEFIAENTLTHSIADLRRALGDDARNPLFIENIPKRGYRIVAPVSGLEETHPMEAAPGPQLKLIVGECEYILCEGSNIVGRSEKAEVRINSDKASRQHARITVKSGSAVIEDLDSKNGTYVQSELLTAPAELHHGDEIHVGRRLAVLRFIVNDGRTLTEEPCKDD